MSPLARTTIRRTSGIICPLLIAALGLPFIGAVANAQSNTQSAKSPETPTTFRVIAPIGQTPTFYYNDGSEDIRVVAGTSLSRDFKSPRNGVIDFYRIVDSPIPDSPSLRVDEGSVRLDGPGPHLIIVANRHNESESATPILKFAVIDDSLEAHPINTVRVLNLSNRQIATKIQRDQALIEPAKDHLFPYQAKNNKTRMQVAVHDADKSKWELKLSGSQVVINQARSTMVIIDELPTRDDPNPDGLALFNLIDTSIIPNN